MRIFISTTILLGIMVSHSFAGATVSCHCFQDRQYQPQQSHAADPYFLATTRNSLMAVFYQVDKRGLVKARMSGADADELWMTHELARQSGLPISSIAAAYRASGSWKQAVDELRIAGRLQPSLRDNLEQPEHLVDVIVDELLMQALGVEAVQLRQLQQQGQTNPELILAVFLSRVGGLEPLEILRRHKSGESWGKLLHDQGLFDGKEIERTWGQLLSD